MRTLGVIAALLLHGGCSPLHDTQISPSERTFQDCEACPAMIVVPAGEFMFGSPDDEPLRMALEEGPQYRAAVSEMAVSRTEITVGQWLGCRSDNYCLQGPTLADDIDPELPVSDVSWNDISGEGGYLDWLNEKAGLALNYRLPSELEWEYLARAGTQTPFPRGQEITSDEANFRGSVRYVGMPASEYRGHAIAVGAFPANGFGLFDVQGNMLEWTSDCWFETLVDYRDKTNANCDRRGLRGGSWLDEPNSLRFAFRRGYDANTRTKNIGFRVVADINLQTEE